MPTRQNCMALGSAQSHEYQLYLAIEDIDHTRTKTKSPQTNGICERFHRTVLAGSFSSHYYQ
jgi:transposase InsO family protein